MDPQHLIETFGTLGVIAIVFAETGLLIGFFLPGDSLLFTAGLFAATSDPNKPHLNIAALLIGCAIAAVAGAETGYVIGRRAGPALFSRRESKIFKREYVDKAESHLARYGHGKAIVLARFIPIIRTFLNPVAGVLEVDARTFTIWNIVGGVLWAPGVVLLGYVLGSSISGVDKYIYPAVAVIVVLSLVPVALEIRKHRREQRALAAAASAEETEPVV